MADSYKIGLWRKIRVFVDLGPGYNYFFLNYDKIKSGVPEEKLTPKSVKKRLDSVPNNAMVAYTVVVFALCSGQITYLLLNSTVSFGLKLIVTSHVALRLYGLSTLFDRLESAPLIESGLNLLSLGVAAFLSWNLSTFWTTLSGGSVLAVAFSAWVLMFQSETRSEIDNDSSAKKAQWALCKI